MARMSFGCVKCRSIVEANVPLTAPNIDRHTRVEMCGQCRKLRTFERIYTAPYITFGMLTKKYTGQVAAVEGWRGTHCTEYPNPNSDLLTGRAQEAAREIKPAVVD